MTYRKYINIVEAANKGCPIATHDIDVNLKNRQKAIDEYHYGPANPDEPESYWKDAADRWNITEKTAKTMLCANCLFALWRLRFWPSFLGLNAVLVAVILLLYWAGTKDLDIAGLGIAQRTGFIGAWLSNSVVLNHCWHISSYRSFRGLKGKVAERQ